MADLGTMTATLGVTTKGVAQAQRAMISMLQTVDKKIDATNARLSNLGNISKPAVTPAMRRIAPVMEEATRSVSNFTATLAMNAQRLRTFGYLASTVVTAPIIMMGKAIVTTAKDFEFSMAKIVGLVGLAKSQVDKFSESILKMAGEVAQTPQALAEAFYFITSAGFKDGAKAMDILTTSAKAATAGLGETADIAKLLVFSMNAYKSTGLTAAKTADMMTVAVREGAIEAEGFASAVQQVIPIASAMGVSLGQVMGTMAAMSLQGANAANSAVYLKGILNSLMKIKPTNQAGKALAELGSSAIKLRNQLAEGPNGLMNVLLQIQEWSKSNPYLLNKVFGNIRAMTGDLSLMGQNLKANQKVIDQVVNAYGDLNKASVAVADTIQVRLNKATATLKSGMVILGETLSKAIIPVYERLVERINNTIKWFDGLSESSQRFILRTVALVAALGPLSLLLSLIGYGIVGLINGLNKLMDVFAALRILMLTTAGPYVIIATAIAAIIGLLVHFKKKSNEAATAQLDFNRALVTVNGNIKKMKDLTSVDLSAMNFNEIFNIKTQALSSWKTAYDNVIAKYEELGVSIEEYNNAVAVASHKNLYSKEDIKNADEILGRTKKYTAYIDQQTEIARENKEIVKMEDKALENLGDQYIRNAQATATNTDAIDDNVDALEREKAGLEKVIEQYIEQTKYIDLMNKISKGGALFEFDINAEKLDLAEQTLKDFVKEVSKMGGSETLAIIGSPLMTFGSVLSNVIAGLIHQVQQYKKIISDRADMEQLRILQMEADAFGGLAGKIEVVNFELQASERHLRDLFKSRIQGQIIPDEEIQRTVSNIKRYKEVLVDLKNASDIRYLQDMYNAFGSAGNASALLSGKIAALEDKLRNLSETGQGATEMFKKYSSQLQDLNVIQGTVDILSNSFNTFFDSVMEGGKNMGDTLSRIFRDLIGDIVKMIAKMLIMKAVMSVIFPESVGINEVLGGLNIGQPGGVFGFPLAKGGIIPPGYPNDTFPALLSSKEKVIPANESLESIEPAARNYHFYLDGVAKGKDLALVIRRYFEE